MSQIQFEEGSSGFLTLSFTDQEGSPVAPNSGTYTLFNKKTKAIINSRDGTTIPSIAASVDLLLEPADNPIIDDTLDVEEHIIMFEWVYGGSNLGKKEVTFDVINLEKVP